MTTTQQYITKIINEIICVLVYISNVVAFSFKTKKHYHILVATYIVKCSGYLQQKISSTSKSGISPFVPKFKDPYTEKADCNFDISTNFNRFISVLSLFPFSYMEFCTNIIGSHFFPGILYTQGDNKHFRSLGLSNLFIHLLKQRSCMTHT